MLEKISSKSPLSTRKLVAESGRDALLSISKTASIWLDRFLKRFSRKNYASKPYRFLANQIAFDLKAVNRGKLLVFSSSALPEVSNETLLMLTYFLQNELGSKVLVVDGTFRPYGVSESINMKDRNGFQNLIYENNITFEESLVPHAQHNIHFLPGGNSEGKLMPYLNPIMIKDLCQKFIDNFDYTIIQQNDIQTDTRYIPFAKLADMVIMHVEERTTPISSFEQSRDLFLDHQIHNVKFLLSEPS